jgi:DNA-binding LytR/AlgR family response regulator
MNNEKQNTLDDWVIAVCGKNEQMKQCFQKTIEKYAQEIVIKIQMKNYQDVYQFVEEYPGYARRCQILFLELEDINAFDISLIESLKNENSRLSVCLVSNRESNITIPYNLNTIGHIFNPVKPEFIIEMLDRTFAYELYCIGSIKMSKRCLTIANKKRKICEDDIVYIRKSKNQIKVVCLDKVSMYYDTLKNIYDQLNKEQFGYTHCGYIANLYYIKDVDRQWVYFYQDDKIPLSRIHQKELLQWHNDVQTQMIRERYVDKLKTMDNTKYHHLLTK